AGASLPAAGGGTADGTLDMTPRSPWLLRFTSPVRWMYIAMPKVSTKNAIASHLVALVRNDDAPRAPNTVAEAPAPKPEPAAAPAPRWMRMKPIMNTASTTYSTIINVKIMVSMSQLGCAAATIAAKSAATRAAPPTRPPSM